MLSVQKKMGKHSGSMGKGDYSKQGDQSENFFLINWHVIRNVNEGRNIFVDLQKKPMAKVSTNFDENTEKRQGDQYGNT